MKHLEKLGYISYERPHQWRFIAMLLTHLLICISTAHASSHLNYQIPFPSNLLLLVSIGILVFNKNKIIGTCAIIVWIFGLLLSILLWIHYLIATVLFGLIFLFIRFVIRKIKERTSERNAQSEESDITAPPDNPDITTSLSVPEPDTSPTETVDSKDAPAKRDQIAALVFVGAILIIGTIFWLVEDPVVVTPENTSHLELGKQHARNGRYFEAINHYDLAIKDYPYDDRPYYYRGKAKAELNQHTAAIVDYTKAIHRNKDESYAYGGRAWSKFKLDQKRAAIADYDKAITISPDASYLYANRGLVKFRTGQRAAAISDSDKAIQLNPDNGDLYRIRGWIKYETGQLFEAITDCDEAIRLEPDNGWAYFYRGLAKRALGHHLPGRKDLEQALQYAEEAGDLNLRSRINAELRRTRQ